MYDSLGYYGILSCAATANNNVNIDQVGDLPTACPSNYLISVTATNASDVRTFSGYGTTHIDLGAPGESVLMAGNNSYSASSGTSFASPCVAGAVALLYSAPCNSFAQVADGNPALAAEWVRSYLLEGVDAVSNLQTEVATGGRLNVRTSLDLLLNNCVSGDCPAPFNVQTAAISNSVSQLLTWNTLDVSWAQVQYRVVGTVDWSVLDSVVGNQIVLSDLQYCGEYECQVRLYCDTVMSDWSNIIVFTTDGCCQHPTYFQTSSVSADAVVIQWNPVLAASNYTVELYSLATGTQTFVVDIPAITLDTLQPCTDYIVTVFSNCVGAGDQLLTVPFQTLGCSSCAEIPYCNVSTASASTEWIANVTFHDLNQSSGSDGGYGDYTEVSTTLNIGQNYTLSITPGFSGLAYYEYFRAWIDWNANGVWEDSELVFDPGSAANTVVSGTIAIPSSSMEGSVRLRVGMTYYGLSGNGEIPAACGSFDYGEFEDYCLTLTSNNGIESALMINQQEVYPNPFMDVVYFKPHGNQGYFQVIDFSGKQCHQGQWKSDGMASAQLEGLSAGFYTFQWWDQKGVHFAKIVKN
jgi:serine protease